VRHARKIAFERVQVEDERGRIDSGERHANGGWSGGGHEGERPMS